MKRTFTLLCILFSALTVFPIGANIVEASWVQDWYVNLGSSNLSSIELFILDSTGTSVDFESPGANNFAIDSVGTTNATTAAWSANIINPDYLLIEGPGINPLYWDTHFSGDKTTQLFNVDFLFYDQTGALNWGTRWDWNRDHWGHGPLPAGVNYDRVPVPEPATMMLLGFGLAGLAGVRRKFKK